MDENFNLDKIKKTPNTVLSHLLIILSFNIQNQIKEKIYQSYFIDGLDIGDIYVLTNIAKQHDISEEIFKNFINDKNIEDVNSKILIASKNCKENYKLKLKFSSKFYTWTTG